MHSREHFPENRRVALEGGLKDTSRARFQSRPHGKKCEGSTPIFYLWIPIFIYRKIIHLRYISTSQPQHTAQESASFLQWFYAKFDEQTNVASQQKSHCFRQI